MRKKLQLFLKKNEMIPKLYKTSSDFILPEKMIGEKNNLKIVGAVQLVLACQHTSTFQRIRKHAHLI